MFIKNYKKLAISDLRVDLLNMIEFGLERSEPHGMINDAVGYNRDFNSVIVQHNEFDLIKGRIFVIGGGKAVGNMAEAIEDVIGSENITAGFVSCKNNKYKTKKIKVIKASHPLPNKSGVKVTQEILDLKKEYDIGKKDLVLNLVSGGASSLLVSPVDGISLDDKQDTARLLLNSGAGIDEINIVRKHLSKVKGGRLAEYFYPARVVSLIISDVYDNDLSVIGSGCTYPDKTTYDQALDVLEKYSIINTVPTTVLDFLKKGSRGKELETVRNLDNAYNYIIGSSSIILEGIAAKAKQDGYNPIIAQCDIDGNSIQVAKEICTAIKNKKYQKHNVVLFGGETTYQSKGEKAVGRNQQFIAQTMLELEDYEGQWAMASFDSDGIDYLSKYAGAIVDYDTLPSVKKKGFDLSDIIVNNETEKILKKQKKSLILTGDTGTNVGDVMIFVKKPQAGK